MLEVVAPGLLTTIQDAGRPDYTDLGVPEAGACDPWALAAANLLLGNPPGAPALEITIVGPALRVLRTCAVALAGADLGAHIPAEGRRLAAGGAYLLRAGTTLAFGGGPGARTYLALAGGIAAPHVLGSAATYLAGGFGGLDGRALRPGDRLVPVRPRDLGAAGRRWPAGAPAPPADPWLPIRVLAGPDAAYFAPDALAVLCDTPWTVAPQSDRMGLRLHGPPLPFRPGRPAELVSRGIVWGALQVPADGRPIVLLADHQTVGGYPVLAVAIRADWSSLAQLPAGSPLRFAPTTLPVAQAAYRTQQAGLREALALLARSDAWDQFAREV